MKNNGFEGGAQDVGSDVPHVEHALVSDFEGDDGRPGRRGARGRGKNKKGSKDTRKKRKETGHDITLPPEHDGAAFDVSVAEAETAPVDHTSEVPQLEAAVEETSVVDKEAEKTVEKKKLRTSFTHMTEIIDSLTNSQDALACRNDYLDEVEVFDENEGEKIIARSELEELFDAKIAELRAEEEKKKAEKSNVITKKPTTVTTPQSLTQPVNPPGTKEVPLTTKKSSEQLVIDFMRTLPKAFDDLVNPTLADIDKIEDKLITALYQLDENDGTRHDPETEVRRICSEKRKQISEKKSGKATTLKPKIEYGRKPVAEKDTTAQGRKVNPEVAEIAQLNLEEFSSKVFKIKSLPKLIDIRNQIVALYDEGVITDAEIDSKYNLASSQARQFFIERIEGDLKKVHDLDALSILSSDIKIEYDDYFDQEIGGPLEDFIMEDREKINALIERRRTEIEKEAEEPQADKAATQTIEEPKTDQEPARSRVKFRGAFIDPNNPNLTLSGGSRHFTTNTTTSTGSSAELNQILHRGAPKPDDEAKVEIEAQKASSEKPLAENTVQATSVSVTPTKSPKPAFEGLPIPPPPSQKAKAAAPTVEAETLAPAPEKKTPPPLPKQKTPIETPAPTATPEVTIGQEKLKAQQLADAKKRLDEASEGAKVTKPENPFPSPSTDQIESIKRSGPMRKTIRSISLKENPARNNEADYTPEPIPTPEPRKPKKIPLPSSSSPYENKSPAAKLVKKTKSGWSRFRSQFSRFTSFFKSKFKK